MIGIDRLGSEQTLNLCMTTKLRRGSVCVWDVVASSRSYGNLCVLQEAALRCEKHFSVSPEDKEELLNQMTDWAIGGFHPNGPDRLQAPAASSGRNVRFIGDCQTQVKLKNTN